MYSLHQSRFVICTIFYFFLCSAVQAQKKLQ